MNTENINTMIDAFIRLDKAPLPEHPDKGFNMSYFHSDPSTFSRGGQEYIDNSGHSCGTAACVVGWVEEIFGNRNALGLCGDVIEEIAHPKVRGCDIFALATHRHAITLLRRLLATGCVDWEYAIANPWEPDSETDTAPSFRADDWLDSILGNSDEMPVPLLEGPKREVAK